MATTVTGFSIGRSDAAKADQGSSRESCKLLHKNTPYEGKHAVAHITEFR
jgi:hypothetical protein